MTPPSYRWYRSIWLVIPFLSFWIGVHYYKSAWVSLLVYHVLLAAPLFLHHRSVWQIQSLIRGFRWRWAVAHVVGCLALYFALVYLAQLKNFGQVLNGGAWKEIIGTTGLGFVVYFVAINPIFEECFWRGLMASKSKWPTLEDIAFGGFHAIILSPFLSSPYIVAFVFGLATMGWFWRQLRWRTDGLAIPWIGHMLGDTTFVIIVASLR